MDDITDALRGFVLTSILPGEDPGRLRDDDHLIESGVLDSLAIVNLVSFIDQRFGIILEPEEISVDNFASIRVLSRFIETRAGSRP